MSKAHDLCLKDIDLIFNDLIESGLIDPHSIFFSESKELLSKSCFQSFYPLVEFFYNSTEAHFNFFLHNSYLFAYVFFLDQSLDSLENSPSTKVRASQISSYLLLDYFEWLKGSYDADTISLFRRFYKEYTNYLMVEKKWRFPQIYLSAYGSMKKIYKKGFLLFFPIELCERNLYTPRYPTLKKLFINYYSFIFLADDLLDLDYDINHKCLTYPIIRYFRLKEELPQSQEDLAPIIPQIVTILQKFLNNIKRFEVNSMIIDDTISRIKRELDNRGIEI